MSEIIFVLGTLFNTITIQEITQITTATRVITINVCILNIL